MRYELRSVHHYVISDVRFRISEPIAKTLQYTLRFRQMFPAGQHLTAIIRQDLQSLQLVYYQLYSPVNPVRKIMSNNNDYLTQSPTIF
jgi:hypothetical protein